MMSFCPACGSRVGAEHRFCGECGEPLPDRITEESHDLGSTGPEASEPVAPDRELEYEIEGLGERVSRSDVEDALQSRGVPFTWDGAVLVVDGSHERDVDEIVRTLTGEDLGSAAPPAEPSTAPTNTAKTPRRLLIAIGVAIVLTGIALLAVTSDDEAAHEQVCQLTEDFWRTVEEDDDGTQLPRLVAIARKLGDGLDDQAEEEGLDEIAGEATRAAIGAALRNPDLMFTALDNLAVLCEDLGLFDDPGAEVGAQPPSGDDVDEPIATSGSDDRSAGEITVSPADHPAGGVMAAESTARLPDDSFVEIDCSFASRETAVGTQYYCVGKQKSGRQLEVNAFYDGSEVVWGFALGGPNCEGASACSYANAIDQRELRSRVANVAGEPAEAVDCDAGSSPGHRVPPGGRIGCQVGTTGEYIEVKVTSDDQFEIIPP